MKKIAIFILFVIVSLFNFNNTYATDACDRLIERQQSFVGEIISAVNIRSYPCTYKSYIIKSGQTGEKYTVVAEVDGYYKVQLENGDFGRIWDKLLVKTNDIISNRYILNSKDKTLINNVIKIVEIKTNKQGPVYKDELIEKIENILKKIKKGERADVLLTELLIGLNKINGEEKEEILKEEDNQNKEETKIIIEQDQDYNQYNVDIKNLKDTWITWHNNERNSLSLNNYSYDNRLDNTAYEWSKKQEEKGTMDHKRYDYSGFYDYNDIEKWFNDRSVNCKIINRTTTSESIGYHSYYCKNNDNCTDKATEALKGIFDMYMDEKGKGRAYDAHYRAITHSDITKMGLGVAIEKKEHNYEYYKDSSYYKLYVTTHYCTEFKD